jgi:protein TonB
MSAQTTRAPAGALQASLSKSSLLQTSQADAEPPSRAVGLTVVVVIHVIVGYALATGLAQKAIEVIKKPMEATLLQEVKIPEPPPPPPPPPPKQIVKTFDPPPQAPPPPFVPPPEFIPPAAPEPPIAVRAETPPPEAPPIAPPAPPAPPAPAKVEIAVVCPQQVQPEMPGKAIREGTNGVVRAEARINGGKVQEVKILSGPRVFHDAVRKAMSQYVCTSSAADVVATQEFKFELK